jgi:hypothetical protein
MILLDLMRPISASRVRMAGDTYDSGNVGFIISDDLVQCGQYQLKVHRAVVLAVHNNYIQQPNRLPTQTTLSSQYTHIADCAVFRVHE